MIGIQSYDMIDCKRMQILECLSHLGKLIGQEMNINKSVIADEWKRHWKLIWIKRVWKENGGASYLRFWKEGNYISSSYAYTGRIISAFLGLLSLGS